nr:tetratricopeptide repeat protein [Lachnospiraceae bacterium]
MDMNQVYATLDEMFASGRNAQAEAYLIECMQSASRQEDYQSLIMLLNEMIGYCRETGQKEKSIGYASQVIELMQSLGLEGTVAYATTLLNVANALRAAGKLQEAYQFYMEVFPIYEANLRPDDFYYASLYNNLSLLLQEMGDYEKAIECLQKALVLAEHTQGKEFEVYVTHANIASTLCKLAQQEKEKERQLGITFERPQLARSYEIATEAATEAEEAVEGFIHEQVKDQHMAAALTAYADAALLLGQYRDAMRYLKDAAQMVEQTVGRTEAYERIEEKYRYAK